MIFVFCFAGFSQSGENPCPKINLIGPQGLFNHDESVKFAAEVSNEFKNYKIEYVWTVSAGQITEGQGKSEIKFLAGTDNVNSAVTVNVKIIGLPDSCINFASDTFGIMPPIADVFPDAYYGKISFKEETVNLDFLLIRLQMLRLQKVENSEGFIVLQFNSKDKKSNKIARLNRILNHIKFRKVNLSRITFVIFEGEAEKTVLWTMNNDTELPTIESENYQSIGAEKLKQKIKELFQKK